MIVASDLLFCGNSWKETNDIPFAVAILERVQYFGFWNIGISGSNFALYMHAYIIVYIHVIFVSSMSIITRLASHVYLIISTQRNTVELHLFGFIGTSSYPDTHKIRIIGFVFENRLHWQFEVRLLVFTVCTFVWTFRPRLIWSSRGHNSTVQYLIRQPVTSRRVSFVEFSINLPEWPCRSG